MSIDQILCSFHSLLPSFHLMFLVFTYCNSSSNSSALLYSAFSKMTSSVLMASGTEDIFYFLCVFIWIYVFVTVVAREGPTRASLCSFFLIIYFSFTRIRFDFVCCCSASSPFVFHLACSHTCTCTYIRAIDRWLFSSLYVCVVDFDVVVVSWSSICFFAAFSCFLYLAANC